MSGSVGWWRANRWWLVVLAGALAALGTLTWRSDAVQGWWASAPHRAHTADAEGWAQVGDVRARLAGLEEVDWLDDGYGDRIEAPDGYTLWAADVSLRSDAPDAPASEEETYSSCEVVLLDDAGREFTAGASAYMTAGIGTAPYDAIAPIVVDRTGWRYRAVRVVQDLAFVGLAVAFGGPVGVGTVMTAFFAGPLIDFFTTRVNTPLLHRLLPDDEEQARPAA